MICVEGNHMAMYSTDKDDLYISDGSYMHISALLFFSHRIC